MSLYIRDINEIHDIVIFDNGKAPADDTAVFSLGSIREMYCILYRKTVQYLNSTDKEERKKLEQEIKITKGTLDSLSNSVRYATGTVGKTMKLSTNTEQLSQSGLKISI